MILAGVNRGFDISDEGLYALLASPNQENVAGIFNYDLFFKLIYKATGHSFTLIQLRVLRLITYFAAAWALTGFWRNISAEPNIRFDIFWFSCLGIFAGYAFLPPTLSYNSLTVVLVCFWLNQVSQVQKTVLTFILLGITLTALVYVKVTTSLLFFPLTILILVFWQKLNLRDSIFLFLPLIFFETLFLILFEENGFSRLHAGIPMNMQRDGYQSFLMVKSVVVGVFWISILVFLFFCIGHFQKRKSSLYPASQIVSFFLVFVICYLTHITDEWNHLVLFLAASFLGFQLGIGTFKPTKTNLWILLLLVLPFILHLGSNVYWLRIGVHYLVFWILAFLWIFKNLNWELGVLIPLFAILMVFNGIWWHPFGHEKPLWTEKTEWKVGEKQLLQIDPELATLSDRLKSFRDQKSQSQLVAAYRIPGYAWLTGTTLPFTPGFWENKQLNAFFKKKPDEMLYNKLQELPQGWKFNQSRELGVYRGDSLLLLWD
jgi:hypothetical protein